MILEIPNSCNCVSMRGNIWSENILGHKGVIEFFEITLIDTMKFLKTI